MRPGNWSADELARIREEQAAVAANLQAAERVDAMRREARREARYARMMAEARERAKG